MFRNSLLQMIETPQVFQISGGAIGSSEIAISFVDAPSAGTVTIEKRLIGMLDWHVVALDLPIIAGQASASTDGAVGAVRVTFAGLVGGATPWLWVVGQPTAVPPKILVTGTTNPRIRVDVGQTGYFEKREFETFREWATATTGTYLLRLVSPINFTLMHIGIELEAGASRLRTYVGGTPTGTFSESPPYLPANTMTEGPAPYAPQIVLSAAVGGTLAGGTLARVGRAKAADNSNFASSVGENQDLIVGRGPGTYYLLLDLAGAIGVLTGRIEERP